MNLLRLSRQDVPYVIMIKLNNVDCFEVVHLTKDIDISQFSSQKGRGLEIYLKQYALKEEEYGLTRTYLVIDSELQQIAAYFSLRTGLIAINKTFSRKKNNYTGIELANFAVNDSYREIKGSIPHFGSYVFMNIILPLVTEIAKYVGAAYLYIYSLPDNKLMEHYKTMGFEFAPKFITKCVYRHVKPIYDTGCIFMWQKI